MKKTKKFLSTIIVIAILISCLSVNSLAYIIGYYKYGDDPTYYWSIFLWNENDQTDEFVVHADVYNSIPTFDFLVSIASIYGWDSSKGQYRDDAADFWESEYNNDGYVWDFMASYDHGGYMDSQFCSDEQSMYTENFHPIYAKGTAIVGWQNDNGTHIYKFYGADANPANIRFDPYHKYTYSEDWNYGK